MDNLFVNSVFTFYGEVISVFAFFYDFPYLTGVIYIILKKRGEGRKRERALCLLKILQSLVPWLEIGSPSSRPSGISDD